VKGIDPTVLAHRVKARRAAIGLSQRAAARDIGVSAATVSRLEQGNRLPEIATILRIAEWLGDEPLAMPHPGQGRASTIEAIELQLRQDASLEPADAELIIGMVRLAYNHLRQL
jgi:transcriptional regulator with XRE-family HTH domain